MAAQGFSIGGDLMVISDQGAMTGKTEKAVLQGINMLAQAVSNTAHAHGWWPKTGRNMGEMIALMHSELSEALESHRNSEPSLWYKHTPAPGFTTDHRYDLALQRAHDNGVPGKPEGIASEFADVIIRILDTCQTLDIPVAQALIDKHNYNLTRPYRHGGKVC